MLVLYVFTMLVRILLTYIGQYFIHYIFIAPDEILNGTGQSIVEEDRLLT